MKNAQQKIKKGVQTLENGADIEPMDDEAVVLPAYMQESGPANYHYGTLKYDKRTNKWIIKGEPCVCQMAKRLFPGCDGRRRGVARFSVNKRTIGDLNWLMLRYPLEIVSKDKWEKDIEAARQHVLRREQANKYPLKITPSPAFFTGQLMEFQKEGVGFLIQNNRTLLADEMGLGKTIEALAWLSETGLYPVLLVVPPHLVMNWEKEIGRFLRVPVECKMQIQVEDRSNQLQLAGSSAETELAGAGVNKKTSHKNSCQEYPGTSTDMADRMQVHVIKGLKPYDLPPAHVYIIHYLLLRGWKNQLPAMGFQSVIFDEIQELRHAGTEKYSAASLLSDSCEYVIGLSGTPIHNKGGEIWNVMNILDYHCLGDWDSFTREWCYGYGRSRRGYGNEVVVDPQLLGEHLKREGLLFRRTKEKVLKELPPKRRLVQEIDSDARVYETLMKTTFDKVRMLDTITEAFEKSRMVEQIAQEERQATGIAKAPYVCAFVKALLEGEEKVLLFAHHHAVMDIYRKELKHFKPVFITGRENDRQKDASVNAFMEGKANICCVSLRAAAGLNLQRATCVVFGELDWSPAVHSQAEDRAHRIGQVDSLLCYYLVSSRGSDQDIQEALGLKVSQFAGIMGDSSETEEDRLLAQSAAKQHIEHVIERLREKALVG